MSIVIYCKNCGKKLRVPESAVGKKGQCNDCKATMTIPAQSETEPVVVMQPDVAPEPISPKQAAKELEAKANVSQEITNPVKTASTKKMEPVKTTPAQMTLGTVILMVFLVFVIWRATSALYNAPGTGNKPPAPPAAAAPSSDEEVVAVFLNSWDKSNETAIKLLDRRVDDGTMNIVKTTKLNLHSFDGVVTHTGAVQYTIRATGDQVTCDVYTSFPVMGTPGNYSSFQAKVEVARDTQKVYAFHFTLVR